MSSAPNGLLLRRAGSLSGLRASILIRDGRIVATGSDADAGPAERVVDASRLLVAPGFIDLQVNGAGGHDVTSDPGAIWAVGEALTQFGVTAFLPTVVTSPPDVIARAQAVLRRGAPDGYRGATPIGLHVEGPFLNPERRGVHDPRYLRAPDAQLAAAWTPDEGVRLVTLAPELPGALPLIRQLAGRGVVVSVGHSAATFAETAAAIDAGATYGTHLFNGMAALDHRAPGVVAALLDDPRVTVGMIADGLHVDPAVVRLAWRLVGHERFSAVTDAVAALAAGRAPHRIGDAALEVDETGARSGGRLAGGLAGLDAVVRNVVAFCGARPSEAVGTVTAVPARLLGMAGTYGSVGPGMCADLTVLTDELRVAATIVGGRVVWHDGSTFEWA